MKQPLAYTELNVFKRTKALKIQTKSILEDQIYILKNGYIFFFNLFCNISKKVADILQVIIMENTDEERREKTETAAAKVAMFLAESTISYVSVLLEFCWIYRGDVRNQLPRRQLWKLN